jgi:hypothetical protein
VWSLAAAGGVVYAGGEFTAVGPGGATTRNRIAAFNSSDGAVVAGFDPNVNQTVYALVVSADGATLYAGGVFYSVGPGLLTARNDLAAFNTSDGSVVAAFNPNLNQEVLALALVGGTIYAGGGFTTVSGGTTMRHALAAFNTSDGSVVAGFDPNVNGAVGAIAIVGGTIYAGGNFTAVGPAFGTTRNFIAAFNATNGAVLGFDPDASQEVDALAVSGGVVYAGGNFMAVGAGLTSRPGIAAFDGVSGSVTSFNPDANSFVGALAISGGTLYAGGTFSSLLHQRRSGLRDLAQPNRRVQRIRRVGRRRLQPERERHHRPRSRRLRRDRLRRRRLHGRRPGLRDGA